MIANNALPKLVNMLLSFIPEPSLPNNPRNKPKEKRPLKYYFVSTKIVEQKDKNGVVHQVVIGKSCRRGEKKLASKRDLHRQAQVK